MLSREKADGEPPLGRGETPLFIHRLSADFSIADGCTLSGKSPVCLRGPQGLNTIAVDKPAGTGRVVLPLMSDDAQEPILCRTTPWYVRRMGLMFLMLAAFAGWFFYDFKVGYPAKAAIYAEYEKVKDQPDGEATWLKIAEEHKWPKAPEPYPPDKIATQGQFAAGMGIAALAVLVSFLLGRGKTLQADATSFTAPNGARVPFDKVFRIDKRKWKHKGLATVFYRDDAGAEKKAVIDDLKYGGAERVLNRVMKRFSGEVIDLDEASAPTDETPTPSSPRE